MACLWIGLMFLNGLVYVAALAIGSQYRHHALTIYVICLAAATIHHKLDKMINKK